MLFFSTLAQAFYIIFLHFMHLKSRKREREGERFTFN